MKYIEIQGCRTHNLKNVNCSIPRNKLVVITGPSGSGKSSLAFDTLYAEGQRRYVESLSAYARQFLSIMEKPDVDHIEGLSPAISIEQKTTSHNPRSTVGTITEIYDYLRLLFARAGQPKCPDHHITLEVQTISQMVDAITALPENTKLMLLAPVIVERKGEHVEVIKNLLKQGYIRAVIDGKVLELNDKIKLDKHIKHNIEVVVDRIKNVKEIEQRLSQSIETALSLTDGRIIIENIETGERKIFSANFACPLCGYSLQELEPRLFSFNSPVGACKSCDGLGTESFFDEKKVINEEMSINEGAIRGWDRRHNYYYQMMECIANHYKFSLDMPFKNLKENIKKIILYGSNNEKINFTFTREENISSNKKQIFEGIIPNITRRYRETDSEFMRTELAKYLSTDKCRSCNGTRLCSEAKNVFLEQYNLPTITSMSIADSHKFFTNLKLPGKRGKIAEKILQEIIARLSFLLNVGLEYLTLERSAETLSGGEAQRIRLASQIGAGLVGVMYILDEPTIGLHQRDNERLLKTLTSLRDMGNTVIVVEHDEDTMRIADYILDIGPGAGIHGGKIVASGTPKEIMNNKNSLTGQYLNGSKIIPIPLKRKIINAERKLIIKGAKGNNLKDVDLFLPLGVMTCITGVSGSGKSTLINQTLYPAIYERLLGSFSLKPEPFTLIEGMEFIDKIINIDQSPIGRTPRSNPATYTGLFTHIRELFAGTEDARARGYKAGRFSFNVKGGRCEACQGDGAIKVSMHFLADIYVNCDICQGKRYNRETLEIKYKQKSILDILEMTIENGYKFFSEVPSIAHKLKTLIDVGLGYLTLGQNATTLSGGEAQRVKLAKELARKATGKTLYLLDEPTTGLHFNDVADLLKVLTRLTDTGNTVVIIEHNLDVIKNADWIIDMGPEGGKNGGQIIATGTPEEVAKCKHSHTGRFLAKIL